MMLGCQDITLPLQQLQYWWRDCDIANFDLQEVHPDPKQKDAYEEAFRKHDEISKGLFETGLAYQ